jgi:hypothetical protein
MNTWTRAAVAAAVFIGAPAYAAPKPVELTAEQLSAVQFKTYSVPPKVAFGATVAALQTMGYVDINSSRDAGTISGITEAKAKTIYNIFWGFGKKKLTQKASLLVEEFGPSGSMIRLNLHINEMKARGIFGTSFSDGKLVRVGEPYADFWKSLDAEIGRRSPPPTPATTPVVPSVGAATSAN